MRLVHSFDGGYGRRGTIEPWIGRCGVCRKRRQPVIMSDASEDEYAPAHVCLPCTERLIKHARQARLRFRLSRPYWTGMSI